MVEVPVKMMIAAIFQRTRPQARRNNWLVRLQRLVDKVAGLVSLSQLETISGKLDSVAAIGSTV
jgi:hypothetical protein